MGCSQGISDHERTGQLEIAGFRELLAIDKVAVLFLILLRLDYIPDAAVLCLSVFLFSNAAG
jgi:hypothetical protein